MAYPIQAVPMTLSDLQGHLSTASFFKCDFSYSCAAVDNISRAGFWSLWALRLESDCGPLVHIFTCSSGFSGKCKRLHTYVKRPFMLG